MYAVLLAGGIPKPDDPLADECAGRTKALIDVAGKPMAQWLLDAVSGSRSIENTLIIGVDPTSGLTCEKKLDFLPDAGGMLDNIMQGLRHVRTHDASITHILLASTDIPTVTHDMIDWRVEAAREVGADLDYAVVERHTMEARFPGSRRSYVRLRDREVCGGDLNVISVNLAEKTDLWDRLVEARKSARRQAGLLGYGLLLRLLTRQISLAQAEQQISERLGLIGRAVVSPYAEIAMDVDKPEQLAILRQDLLDKGETQ